MIEVKEAVKTRYTLIDILRGIAIICMVYYHGVWDLENVFGVDIGWFGTQVGVIFQRSIRWTFILLSGFCWPMGRKMLQRGLVVFACGWVITLVTAIFMPNGMILFGVLSLLGSAMLLTVPMDKLLRRLQPWAGLAVCIVLFLLTKDVQSGILAFRVELPDWLYANAFTAYLGFPKFGFYSSDYVPLLPWLFAYWMGYYAYRIMEKHDWLFLLTKLRFKPLEWVGRHSLEIYMLHQPIVYGILYIVFLFV